MKPVRALCVATVALALLFGCQSKQVQTESLPTTPGRAEVSHTAEAVTASLPAATSTNTVTPMVGTETPRVRSVAGSDKIAFLSNRDGQIDLWWMNIDGTRVERLTDDSLIERWPSWSPDATLLAYVTRPDSITATSDLLWILDLQTRKKVQLTDQALEGLSAPTWSPDGDTIAYDTWTTSGTPRIFLISVNTGKQVEISQDRSDPLWSPNGQFLAVLGPSVEVEFGWSSPVGFFSIITVEGEPLEHVNRGWDWQKHATGMAWSHAADRLLVTSEAGKSFMPGVASLEIVEIEAMTASISVNHMMKCNDYDCDFYSPSWFPGDKEILFIAAVPLPLRAPYDTPEPDEPEGRWWIYRATDDLGSIQTVFESDLPISDAALSPDGSQVVFVQGEYAEAELWLLDLTGGKVTQLTDNEVNDSSPIWNPGP